VHDRESLTNLLTHGVIAPLCKSASRSSTKEDEECSLIALKALMHLSTAHDGIIMNQSIEDMIDCGGVSRMTEIALSPIQSLNSMTKNWKKRVHLALALLSNMTRTERGALELCGRSMPEEAIPISTVNNNENTNGDVQEKKQQYEPLPTKPAMSLLTSRFLSDTMNHLGRSSPIDTSELNEDVDVLATSHFYEFDPYQYFAMVLMNVTQVDQGRMFIMKLHHTKSTNTNNETTTTSTSMLQRITPQLRSWNTIRRRGIAGMIKNCCFEKDFSYWLLNDVKITPQILYPLAGPEELEMDEKKGMDPDLWLEGPDKVRELDETTRLLLVECILLLCACGRKARESLRLERTYIVLKFADMVEESEMVSEKINECVQFLRRDEEGTDEGSSDRLIDDVYGIDVGNVVGKEKQMLALPAPSAAKTIIPTHDDGDYDNID
jgi:hypothetical protein